MVILAYPEWNKDYRLYSDISDQSIGACLSQLVYDQEKKKKVEKLIYSLSHKLIDKQTRWSTTEKEAYAIHYAFLKLNYHFHRATLTFYTYHKCQEILLNSPLQNKKIQTWALSIASYDCKIPYLKSKDNVCADLLSRAVDESKNNDGPRVDIDVRNYIIRAINSNVFELKEFTSCKNAEDPLMTHERPSLLGIDVIRVQESDKDILDLKSKIKNGRATEL